MPLSRLFVFCLALFLVGCSSFPDEDLRRIDTTTWNTRYEPREYDGLEEWQSRKDKLLALLRVGGGLYPESPATPLNVRRFPALEDEGYTVEPVLFESFPGFYSAGSLYKPKGEGPFPALIHAHGHKPGGRFQEDEIFGVQSASVHLARMGIVVFAPDMLGFNDSLQFGHSRLDPTFQLWGLNVMGLQTLTNLRSLDFLESLSEVDKERIGIMGWSGGGDQTIVLAALDDRIKVSIPMVTTSANTQSTCICGNQPGLRYATDHVEMTALAAPKPLLLVSCTGDYTWETPDREFPAIKAIYQLYGEGDKAQNAHVDFDWHNLSPASRRAVYQYLKEQWGLQAPVEERAFNLADLNRLRAFPEDKLPPEAADRAQLFDNWKTWVEEQLHRDFQSDDFESAYRRGLRLVLGVEVPEPRELMTQEGPEGLLLLHRRDGKDRVPLKISRAEGPVTLLVSADGKIPEEAWKLNGTVAMVEVFSGPRAAEKVDLFRSFHLTETALKVQDILTAISFLREEYPEAELRLVGLGEAGLWSLLAAAVDGDIDYTVADADRFACDEDTAYLE
ncbi:MAG: acetylxylan esterase, partial [Candidatus Eremiobacteraeota bacterium]|nr:acetylxylan esterase [Candidatus Eremiobacteraeota bacterium]